MNETLINDVIKFEQPVPGVVSSLGHEIYFKISIV